MTAWFLMTVFAQSVSFSPPLQSLDECERLHKIVKESAFNMNVARCVEMRVLK